MTHDRIAMDENGVTGCSGEAKGMTMENRCHGPPRSVSIPDRTKRVGPRATDDAPPASIQPDEPGRAAQRFAALAHDVRQARPHSASLLPGS